MISKADHRQEIEIYTPAELTFLLFAAVETDIDLIPALVLGGFAGLRPLEFHAEGLKRPPLQWEALNRRDKLIHVRGQKVRTKATRDIPIQPLVESWLEPFRKLEGAVWNHRHAHGKKWIAVGCSFGCRFCYVPSVSTLFLGWRLLRYGVLDADNERGTYCLIRRWDEGHYRRSLRQMLAIPVSELAPNGHRAIMLCTNTDPYQPVFHPDPAMHAKLEQYLRTAVRRSLEILLEPEFAAFNVRVQTRGLAVENDLDVMQEFGNRILLGMSIPSPDNSLVKVYEPKAPAPTRRLEVLAKAAALGIPVYVAMAPTFPECDEGDIRQTLAAFAELPFQTIFHEPINARAKNVDRIVEEADRREMLTGAEVIRHRVTRIPWPSSRCAWLKRSPPSWASVTSSLCGRTRNFLMPK